MIPKSIGVDDSFAWEGDRLLQKSWQETVLVYLTLPQGVPLLLGSDEWGRSQQGNNNAYCQDNEISWFDWDLSAENQALLKFTQQLIEFRQRHEIFRQRNWLETS